MPDLVIKHFPKALRRKLEEQAARHHRSIAKEALALLEQALGADVALKPAPPPFKGRFALTDRFLDGAKRAGRD